MTNGIESIAYKFCLQFPTYLYMYLSYVSMQEYL